MTESYNQKGFWDFCCEHPIAAFFIVLAFLQCINGIVLAASDHADQAKDAIGCKLEINKPVMPEKAQGDD